MKSLPLMEGQSVGPTHSLSVAASIRMCAGGRLPSSLVKLSRLTPPVVLKQEQYATRASDAQPLHAISQVIFFFQLEG